MEPIFDLPLPLTVMVLQMIVFAVWLVLTPAWRPLWRRADRRFRVTECLDRFDERWMP